MKNIHITSAELTLVTENALVTFEYLSVMICGILIALRQFGTWTKDVHRNDVFCSVAVEIQVALVFWCGSIVGTNLALAQISVYSTGQDR